MYSPSSVAASLAVYTLHLTCHRLAPARQCPAPAAYNIYSGTVAPLSGLDHRRSATRPSTLYPLTHDQITRLSPDERLALIAQLWVRFLSKAKPRTPAEGVFELADQRWIKGFKGSKTNVQPRTVTNKKVVLVNSFFSHCFDQF
jgi:hypothetical protein